MDLSVELGRLRLPNPILVASGTFGYARESASFVPLEKLGGIVPKTITASPRMGNPPPRIVETAAGMLNAIGLDNDGIDHFLDHHLPYFRTLDVPLIVNIAGTSADEFAEMAARLGEEQGIAALELNLSCPNVAHGTDFAQNPQVAEKLVSKVRSQCSLPILAKLTPNIADIVPIARAAEAGGADGVTLINTLVGTAIDWRKRKPILANIFGGMSGPAIKPVALRFVLQVRRAVKIPIMGVGGIRTVDDVLEFLVAGASAVQVGTANFFDPMATTRLLEELPRTLEAAGIESIRSLIGSVQLP